MAQREKSHKYAVYAVRPDKKGLFIEMVAQQLERRNGMGYRKKSRCELVDAFAVLTKQGVVLLSDDARLTPAEDNLLYAINQAMKNRKEQSNGKG